jgi:uncharacterized membrane-anchored protein
MEEQNAEILKSLSTRADTQIKIQRAVEGLSIIAITYYLLNLFKLIYSGLTVMGLQVSARDALLGMAPLAIAVLGLILVRVRKVKHNDH